MEYIVEDLLFTANYKGNVGRRRLARQIVEELSKHLEDEPMRNKQWDLAHNFPSDLSSLVERLERELGLRNMMRDERAVKVYRWVAEQEANGQTVKKFAEWALQPERVQYVGKYKNTPEAIQRDWVLAFDNKNRSSADEILI